LSFVSVLKADTTEKSLNKKARIVIPQQDNSKPGDADDIGGKVKLEFQQEPIGGGDHLRSSQYSINPGINKNVRDKRFIILIFYHFLVERTLLF
jgi:hypothetical protein